MSKEQRRFWHESEIAGWLEEHFPNFESKKGQKVLEKRADEIVREIDNYFIPSYMMVSGNAQYLKPDIEDIRKAHKQRDYKEMGRALETFKFNVGWL